MASAPGRGLSRSPIKFPRKLAKLLRPEIDDLADEIVVEIGRCVPEYEESAAESSRPRLKRAVEEALIAFVERIEDPGLAHDRLQEVCVRLGKHEARDGRSMDALQAAYGFGVQLAWRRVVKVGQRESLSTTVMSSLADALFGYMEEMASLSHQGYLAAKTPPEAALEERRRRLLRLILEGSTVAWGTLTEQAALAGWSLPDEVTPILLEDDSRWIRTLLDADVLVDVGGPQPLLLMPGPPEGARLRMLRAALAGQRAVVGLAVAPIEAAASVRWSRQCLDMLKLGLVEEGQGRLTLCDDHVMSLWLLVDTELIGQVARHQFAAMSELTGRQRARMVETLGAWIGGRGSAVEIAERLELHPQSVRHRLRQLRETFGDQLDDPDARFALEAVLQASRLCGDHLGVDPLADEGSHAT